MSPIRFTKNRILYIIGCRRKYNVLILIILVTLLLSNISPLKTSHEIWEKDSQKVCPEFVQSCDSVHWELVNGTKWNSSCLTCNYYNGNAKKIFQIGSHRFVGKPANGDMKSILFTAIIQEVLQLETKSPYIVINDRGPLNLHQLNWVLREFIPGLVETKVINWRGCISKQFGKFFICNPQIKSL